MEIYQEAIKQLTRAEAEVLFLRALPHIGRLGDLSPDVWRAIQGLVPLWAAELLIIKESSGLSTQASILLTRYDGGVKKWLGDWHIPGGYALFEDEDIAAVARRIGRRELKAEVTLREVIDCHFWKPGKHPEGKPLSVFVHCTLDDPVSLVESDEMRFFPLDRLPSTPLPVPVHAIQERILPSWRRNALM